MISRSGGFRSVRHNPGSVLEVDGSTRNRSAQRREGLVDGAIWCGPRLDEEDVAHGPDERRDLLPDGRPGWAGGADGVPQRIAGEKGRNDGHQREHQSPATAGLRQQRDNVRLLAPHDGLITAREAEPGSTVVAGQPVLRMIEPASLWVRTRFDQGRSAGLAVGLQAEIALRSNPSRLLPGKVVRLDPVSDSVTEERIAQIAFDTLPENISLGEMAEVTLRLPAKQAQILVPNASLKRQGEQTGVWVYRSAKAQFVAVKPGKTSLDGQVEILEGLNDGEQVIVHSEKEIVADSRLKVVDSLTGAGK